MSEEEDAAVVDRVLAGDVEAFAGIVRRWQVPLVTLAFRFCRDRDQAEDMAQAVFVKTFRSLGQWRRDAAFSSWLFALAANVYRSELRRKQLLVFPLDAVRDAIRADASVSADISAEREESVRTEVAALPAKYRDVLVLFYFHQMDVYETARSLGLVVGTVKARLHRGRKLLRRRLGATFTLDDEGGSGDD